MNEATDIRRGAVGSPAGRTDHLNGAMLPKAARISIRDREHIEEHLSRILRSPVQRQGVWINAAAGPVKLGLIQTSRSLRALIFATAERSAPVREVLKAAGIVPARDEFVAGNDPFVHFILCSLPTDIAGATRVVSDLLLKGYGLPEAVELDISHSENALSVL